MTTQVPQKRPRISPHNAERITALFDGETFERAVNNALREVEDIRIMLAEAILDIEGDRSSMSEWHDRRGELAASMNAVSLMRVLSLRLRDRGIDL